MYIYCGDRTCYYLLDIYIHILSSYIEDGKEWPWHRSGWNGTKTWWRASQWWVLITVLSPENFNFHIVTKMIESDFLFGYHRWYQKSDSALSQVRICRLPPPSPLSEMVQFSWKMRNVLNIMKNKFTIFSFMNYGRFLCSKFLEKWTIFRTKSAISQNLNIGKLIFNLFQNIAQIFGIMKICFLDRGGRVG